MGRFVGLNGVTGRNCAVELGGDAVETAGLTEGIVCNCAVELGVVYIKTTVATQHSPNTNFSTRETRNSNMAVVLMCIEQCVIRPVGIPTSCEIVGGIAILGLDSG
jgi:hypothetical protein